jgi:prolyl-tRNA synthetase
LELGPRDIKAEHVMVKRRTGGDRETVPFSEVSRRIPEMLEEVQREIYQRALAFREVHSVLLQPGQPLVDALEGGGPGEPLRFVRAHWCGAAACEERVKAETHATIRCVELDAPRDEGPCLVCGEPSDRRVVFARAY